MKILCVLYDDPKDGMPKNYPLSELPELKNKFHTNKSVLRLVTTHFSSIIGLDYTLCLFYKLEGQLVDHPHLSQMMVRRIPIEMDLVHLVGT